jgi:hypothetical protein
MPQHHDCRKQAISLRTKIVGVNAMLQQLLPDIRMLTMPLRKWPLILFALPFVLVAPHHCIAGPLHRSICRDSYVGELRDDPFPTATVHRQRPTSIFRFEKVIDLRRITPPTGFRVRDPNNANPNGLSLLARPWPPPCPVLPGNLVASRPSATKFAPIKKLWWFVVNRQFHQLSGKPDCW